MCLETHFTISLVALRILRQCMEEAFGCSKILNGYRCPRDWEETWMRCLECLDQTEGRAYELEGEHCIVLARVIRLLCVATMDDWSIFPCLDNEPGVLQLRAVLPTSENQTWRDFHAQVGRYHKFHFERAVEDLGELRAVWDRLAGEASLPYSSWLFTAQTEMEETLRTL